MDGKMKHNIGMVAGVIVLLSDLYWTYIAYSASYGNYASTPVMLGIIILIFTIVWLWADM